MADTSAALALDNDMDKSAAPIPKTGTKKKRRLGGQHRKKIEDYELDPDYLDSALYSEEKLNYVYNGIAQNINVEMSKHDFSVFDLSKRSNCDYTHLNRILSQQQKIGLSTLIKVACALKVSPSVLFPYDFNLRKSNGSRFDDLTKECDLSTVNMILGIVADIVKDQRRLKRVR